MKNRINSWKTFLVLIISCLVITGSSTLAQTAKKEKSQMPMHDMPQIKKEALVVLDSTVVRKGIIDLKAIDKNRDGKVYQDQMDWNVISDKPGKCPLCKMTLKEVTLKQAEKNLTDNGFKVK